VRRSGVTRSGLERGAVGSMDPDAAINAEVDGVDGVEALCKARY